MMSVSLFLLLYLCIFILFIIPHRTLLVVGTLGSNNVELMLLQRDNDVASTLIYNSNMTLTFFPLSV